MAEKTHAPSAQRVALANDAVLQINALAEVLRKEADDPVPAILLACAARISMLCDAVTEAINGIGTPFDSVYYKVHAEYADAIEEVRHDA